MKKKTINKILNKKFEEFADSIKDSKVKQLVKENSIITGGCIASMLLKEPVNDFDVYFTNKETVLAVANYYVEVFNKANNTSGHVLDGANMSNNVGGVGLNMTPDRVKIFFKSEGVVTANEENLDIENNPEEVKQIAEVLNEAIKSDNKEKYRPVFMSANAISLSNQIQLIIRFYGDAEQIHDNYDFVHCTNYWTSKESTLVLKQTALESLMAKELIYIGSKYPLASVIRTRKFITRHWTINAGQYLKMCFQISKLDLTNINVLEDQLTGVDIMHFSMLIQVLKEQVEKSKEDKTDFSFDYNYIVTIIDKIF